MELFEAIFSMFGDSIISNYLRLIENTSPFKDEMDKRKKLFKKIFSIAAAVIFLVAFVSVMLAISCQGIIRNISLLIILICGLIVVIYILLGYVLNRIYDHKNGK